jgi:hypothetical protein
VKAPRGRDDGGVVAGWIGSAFDQLRLQAACMSQHPYDVTESVIVPVGLPVAADEIVEDLDRPMGRSDDRGPRSTQLDLVTHRGSVSPGGGLGATRHLAGSASPRTPVTGCAAWPCSSTSRGGGGAVAVGATWYLTNRWPSCTPSLRRWGSHDAGSRATTTTYQRNIATRWLRLAPGKSTAGSSFGGCAPPGCGSARPNVGPTTARSAERLLADIVAVTASAVVWRGDPVDTTSPRH